MIDEEKIKAATDVVFADVLSPKANICMSAGFIRGIEWFKEAIWHGLKEEPERHKLFLMQWTKKGRSYSETGTIEHKYDWQYVVMTFDDVRWCYIDDILPKGGKK